jgi:hypothetical protein
MGQTDRTAKKTAFSLMELDRAMKSLQAEQGLR